MSKAHNMSASAHNLSHVCDNLSHVCDNLSHVCDNMLHVCDNLSHVCDNILYSTRLCQVRVVMVKKSQRFYTVQDVFIHINNHIGLVFNFLTLVQGCSLI